MTLDDFNDYLERSGDVYGTMYPGNIILDNSHGFCIMDVSDGVLIVYQCYGDGEYWVGEIRKTAKKLHLEKIRFITMRNPKAFERKYGFKTVGYIMNIDVEED